jgi:dienelactone hydrolase/DNA-directed RNA polymerase subunit RPC12/RpoP
MPRRTLRCNDCGCRFDLDREDEGRRRVRCPECGAAVPVRSGRSRPGGGSGMKWVVLILLGVGVLGLLCCGGLIGLGWHAMKPTEFPEQTQDYVDARKTFKTTLTRKGPAPQAGLIGNRPPEATEVTYTSGDLKLKAWVNRPAPGPGLKPGVLFLHGGFAFGADDWEQCQPFRDAGFVTMTPILRGENGQPGSYSMFYDEVDDVLAAAELLARTPGVDPNRIFVCGHSVGGTLAMLAAMTSKRFKGCASFSGSPDQVRWSQGQEELVPFDRNNMTEMAMRSPLAFPKSFKCPARLYYGDEEILFKFSTQQLAEKATAAGSDVQAVEVPGDHFTSVDPAMRQAITFFQQRK